MVITGWVSEENFYKLTRAEAVGFVYFLIMEERRHEKDIRDLRKMVKKVREHFGIEGLELNAIYSDVYGKNQTSGVRI